MDCRERTCHRLGRIRLGRNRPGWIRVGRIRVGGLLFGLWLTGLAIGFAASAVSAQSLFVDRTRLISVQGGSSLDGTVFALGTGSVDRARKAPINLRPWYTPQSQNVSAMWMTEIRPDFGFYWGFQTGERGDKFRINPGVNLGFIMLDDLTASSTLSFTATGVLGGWLKEGTCQADYGQIGGVQTVNCRLAASALPPAETLKYLVDIPPPDWVVLGIRYTFRF